MARKPKTVKVPKPTVKHRAKPVKVPFVKRMESHRVEMINQDPTKPR